MKEGRELVVSLRKRIDYIIGKSVARVETNNQMYRPKVLCIEWNDSLCSAGHWIPQMVEIAGGVSLRGSPSRRISMEEIIQFQPDKVIFISCGFVLNRTLQECDLNDLAAKYGDISYFKFGRQGIYFVKHPDHIQSVLVYEFLLSSLYPPERDWNRNRRCMYCIRLGKAHAMK